MAVSVVGREIVTEHAHTLKLGEFHHEAKVRIPTGGTYSPVDVTGSGYLMHFGTVVGWGGPDKRLNVQLIIDGSTVLSYNFESLPATGGYVPGTTTSPFMLIRHDQLDTMTVDAGIPLRFETSLEIKFTNPTGTWIDIQWFQAHWRQP